MKNVIKRNILRWVDVHNEDNKILEFISSLQLMPEQKLLDVGCGQCNKLRLIVSLGINAVGVDINPILVQQAQKAGFDCITVDEFNLTDDTYEVMLMSHIIEHFMPEQLLEFMDGYLDRLSSEGYLIIATPLNSPYFYDDFDHVKPYHPTGINMVFGGSNLQVQYYSRNHIELCNLWFRREPLRLTFLAGLYVKKNYLLTFINISLAILFRLSFGIIGRTNGWVGLYQKVRK
jgi:SAM-dependent methyltransferase